MGPSRCGLPCTSLRVTVNIELNYALSALFSSLSRRAVQRESEVFMALWRGLGVLGILREYVDGPGRLTPHKTSSKLPRVEGTSDSEPSD